MRTHTLAFTPGEPAGIGPDLAVLLAQQAFDFCMVAIADPGVLAQRSRTLGLDLKLKAFDGSPSKAGELQVIDIDCPRAVKPGELNVDNAHYVLQTIEHATKGCLTQEFDALVTGPIQKSIINEAGISFSGHTEFLATLTDAPLPVMMLANSKVRVTLATTHLPLKKVSSAITPASLEQVIQITYDDLRSKFGINEPALAICGLNPHAGENGHLGHEEIEVITPVVEKLTAKGLNLLGPLPADTTFTPDILQRVDAVVAMYHDQGLPVVKALGFGETVNITLGLPIIRTSVDHGTALPLAGSGQVKTSSLIAAFNLADTLVSHRSA